MRTEGSELTYAVRSFLLSSQLRASWCSPCSAPSGRRSYANSSCPLISHSAV